MIRDYIYFDGKSLEEYGLYITNAGIYNAPERDYEKVSVPGRNGDLLFENNRYSNVELSYPAVIVDDFDMNFSALKAYLLSKKGYFRLEDTFHPDEFYQATFKGITNIKVTPEGKGGTFALVFDRKPQKFLKSGEKTITVTGPFLENWEWTEYHIYNPTKYDALPLLKVYGTGYVDCYNVDENIAYGIVISTSLPDGYDHVDIDCDLQEASYYDQTIYTLYNCNPYISGDQIVLNPGDNIFYLYSHWHYEGPDHDIVVFDKQMTSIEITPRWWTL